MFWQALKLGLLHSIVCRHLLRLFKDGRPLEAWLCAVNWFERQMVELGLPLHVNVALVRLSLVTAVRRLEKVGFFLSFIVRRHEWIFRREYGLVVRKLSLRYLWIGYARKTAPLPTNSHIRRRRVRFMKPRPLHRLLNICKLGRLILQRLTRPLMRLRLRPTQLINHDLRPPHLNNPPWVIIRRKSLRLFIRLEPTDRLSYGVLPVLRYYIFTEDVGDD